MSTTREVLDKLNYVVLNTYYKCEPIRGERDSILRTVKGIAEYMKTLETSYFSKVDSMRSNFGYNKSR